MEIGALLIFIFTTILIYFSIKYFYNSWDFYKLSWQLPGPIALPIIGNALHFLCPNDELFTRAVDSIPLYSSPLRFWFGPKFSIVIADVENASIVMSSSKFTTKDDIYRFMKVFNGEGLISASGAKWKSDRRLIGPWFLKRNITQYLPVFQEHAQKLCEILQKQVGKNVFNVKLIIHRCVIDIINEIMFGIKSDAQTGGFDSFLRTVKTMYELVHVRMVKVWLQIDFIFKNTKYYPEQIVGKRIIHNHIKFGMQKNLKTLNERNYQTLYEFLAELQKEHREFGDDQEMIYHLSTLISASEDTTMIISCFTLVLLGMYPEIQQKVIDEIDLNIGKDSKNFTASDLEKLEYLDMCIKEVLRLFPIAPFVVRKTIEDCKIGDLKVPKNCTVIVAIHNIHRNHEYWEKPNEFYPEHFLQEAVKERSHYAYMPFSAGPRGCPGKVFALLAIKTILVNIFQEYTIESPGRLHDKKLKSDISVRFKDDQYPIKIKHRHL